MNGKEKQNEAKAKSSWSTSLDLNSPGRTVIRVLCNNVDVASVTTFILETAELNKNHSAGKDLNDSKTTKHKPRHVSLFLSRWPDKWNETSSSTWFNLQTSAVHLLQ